MADVNLSIGSSNVDKSYDGVKPNQKIHFYCSYNSSGTVTIRCNVSVTSYDFNTSQGAGYITIDGSTTTRTTGTYNVEKNSNKDFLTATKSITAAKTFTVSAKMDAYAGGCGPTPSGGRTFSFTVYVPGIITSCGAPTSFSVNKSQAAPSSSLTLSWSGAKAGTANAIQRYYTEYTTNGGSSWAATNPYNSNTSSTSSSLNITLPATEGATYGFRVRTEGAAGSSYYSGYKAIYGVCTTYSRPTMSACSASQSYGTYTITWGAATAGVNNAVSKYEIWYSYKTSSSGSWSTRTHIANVANTVRSYTWSGGTVGYYYRFSVVALGTNYSYSATTDTWSAGYQKDYAYTACGAPSNLKSNNTNPTIGQTITLSWTAGTAGTNNSVTGYELYYSMDSGSTYTLISSSIGSSTTSYSYTVPRTVGQIRFRIRTKGSAGSSYYSGYNYSSSYQTITIKQANAPTAGTVTASLIDYGSSGNKAFSINWANFAGNTYNPISGYSLYYKTSKTIDDDDFGNLVTISSNLSSSTTSYTYTGGIWNNYYKFVVKAKGQYYGESPYAYSTAVQKVTTASTPPSAFEYKGSGFIEIKGENYVVPGLKVAVMPIGASNAVSYTIQYREVKSGVASSWKTIASSISLNKYTSFIKVSKDLTDGDYVNFRALSRNTAGDESAYFPSDSELGDYKLTVKTFKKENLLHPRVQIKRAHTDTWARESGDYNGIRIYDGEFAYDTERKELRIGNYLDNTPKRFTELGNLFGLLDIGTDNNFSAMNSAVIGTENTFKESKGYAILGSNNSNLFYLSSVEGLSVGMAFKFSYTGSTYSGTISSISTSNSSITITGSTAYYYETGEHNRNNGALWIESDQTRGDTVIDSPSGLLVGDNNKNVGLRNLIVGNNNSIDASSGYTDSSRQSAYNSLVVGGNNKITGYLSSNTVLGYSNTVSAGGYKLITGYSNTSSGGSYTMISGGYNTSSGAYNLIGYYLTGGGASYGLTIGKYNSTVTDSLFVVGSGTSTSARSNAFYITTSAIQMNKPTTISSTLSVSYSTTLFSTLSVSGATTLSSTLKVSNSANFNSSLNVNGTSGIYFRTSEGGSSVSNFWASGSSLSINGSLSISASVSLSGTSTISGTLTYSPRNLYLDNGQTNFWVYGSTNRINFHGNDWWGFYPYPSNVFQLGGSSYKWTTVWATNGSIQTSNRDEKYNINYIEDSAPRARLMSLSSDQQETITSNDIIDFIKNIKPATFIYKNSKFGTSKDIQDLIGTEDMASVQLGLIADDIASEKIYKYIGVDLIEDSLKIDEFDKTNSNNNSTNINHQYGLQPLPLATLALASCKILLNKIEELEEQIVELKSIGL